jgi:hypothetical protein
MGGNKTMDNMASHNNRHGKWIVKERPPGRPSYVQRTFGPSPEPPNPDPPTYPVSVSF